MLLLCRGSRQRALDHDDIDLLAVGDADQRKVVVAGLLGIDRSLARVDHQRAGNIVLAVLVRRDVDAVAVEDARALQIPLGTVCLDAENGDLLAAFNKRQHAALLAALRMGDRNL